MNGQDQVLIYKIPDLRPGLRGGWVISSCGAVLWRDRLLVLWPGYETDLASIPRLVRPLIGNDEPGLRLASILHDAAYRNHPGFSCRRLTREEADRVLYDVAVHRGLPRWKAAMVWVAVRLFGWVWWRQ